MIAARWLLSISALGVIGAFGASLLFYPVSPRIVSTTRRFAAGVIVSALFVIAAQLWAWFGAAGFTDPENVWTMLSITLWGWHWSWLASVAVAVAIAVSLPLATRPRAWILSIGAAAFATAVVVPLVGHGGTHDEWITMLHRVHLFGAGLWIGSLMVAVLAGYRDAPQLLASLRKFAPIAFTGAAMIAVSGGVLAWDHIRPLSTLWTTEYGQALSAKLIAVLAVGALGFVNWRNPRLVTVVAELVLAVGTVLLLTALLSELQMPGH